MYHSYEEVEQPTRSAKMNPTKKCLITHHIRLSIWLLSACCCWHNLLADSLCCTTLSLWAELCLIPFRTARDGSKIPKFHDIPWLAVDNYCATELAAIVVS